MVVTTNARTSSSVATTFTAGLAPLRIRLNKYTGSGVDPAADKKLEIMKSSSEITNARSAPEMMPGMSIGNVIRLRIMNSLAPRSVAASK